MIKHKETLSKIAKTYWQPEIDYFQLTQATNSYFDLVLGLSKIDLEAIPNSVDKHFDNGKAIGTTWAAKCLEDIMRTKRFSRGVWQAVESVRQRRPGPVHLLYAGTGPFATLVLPLLSHYSPDELQLHFLEVNEVSIESVRKVIRQLNAEAYVQSCVQADATKYQLPKPAQIDILLSETMQHALVREQQVPIVLNLFRQMRPDALLVPEAVHLDAALVSPSRQQHRMMGKPPFPAYYQQIGRFFSLDRHTDQQFLLEKGAPDRFKASQFPIPKGVDASFNRISVMTDLIIFGENRLSDFESSLTIPQILEEFRDQKDIPNSITLEYIIEASPRIGHSFP